MKKKKIFFAMIEAGSGHKSPALAMMNSVEKLYPGKYELKMVDFLKDIGFEGMDSELKNFWNICLAHPFLYNVGYYVTDSLSIPVDLWKRMYMVRLKKGLVRFLNENKPDVLVSTHFYSGFAVQQLRKKYKIKTKLINFNSDLNVHTLWITHGLDYYMVFSEKAKKEMMLRGIPAKRIVVFPYPVRNEFMNIKKSKEAILNKLRLDSKKKTLLITFGGQGIGELDKYIDEIIESGLSLNVVVVTGRNEELRRMLKKRYSNIKKLNLVVLGYVNNMNELLNASDFAFIKPGAATTFESVFMKKPVIIYTASANENENMKFLVRNGFGLYAGPSLSKFIKHLRTMMDDTAYSRFVNNYNKLNLKSGSDDIAKFIAKVADSN